jgi:hypothetical protein
MFARITGVMRRDHESFPPNVTFATVQRRHRQRHKTLSLFDSDFRKSCSTKNPGNVAGACVRWHLAA